MGVSGISTFISLSMIFYMKKDEKIEVEVTSHLEQAEAVDLCTDSTSSCDD